MDPTDIDRAIHRKREEYKFFLSAHRTFSKINHVIGWKTSLSIFTKIELIPTITSHPSSMRVEMKMKSGKFIKMCKVKQHSSE